MIAVTAAADARGWVAVPPWSNPLRADGVKRVLDWSGTVAVVEQHHIYLPPDPMRPVHSEWVLTGFAEVAEVVPIWGYAEQDTYDPDNVDMCLIVGDPETGECTIWYNMGSPAPTNRHLPHAEPGGLALRLEQITDCPTGECAMSLPEHGEWCHTCARIGHPVTVVDLVGEIGRWDQ